ncbi:hypothetical protein LAZ67_17003157 [Cordylochernes scorpioides]|uniref:Uncharacterized protein n=1 Tax=Cordylochernes scorpioides TaxID=51811 RepID=A0ABY6LJC3_9ARAC|nr:hypothetical protein LAZ67_17003157 [Cordylochernes scorpioides]
MFALNIPSLGRQTSTQVGTDVMFVLKCNVPFLDVMFVLKYNVPFLGKPSLRLTHMFALNIPSLGRQTSTQVTPTGCPGRIPLNSQLSLSAEKGEDFMSKFSESSVAKVFESIIASWNL